MQYYTRNILSHDVCRIPSAIVSGVGFLGAGVITQPQARLDYPTTNTSDDLRQYGSGVPAPGAIMVQEVRPVAGLTTAAAIWMSAAVGVSSASGSPLLTFTGVFLTVLILNIHHIKRYLFSRVKSAARRLGFGGGSSAKTAGD